MEPESRISRKARATLMFTGELVVNLDGQTAYSAGKRTLMFTAGELTVNFRGLPW